MSRRPAAPIGIHRATDGNSTKPMSTHTDPSTIPPSAGNAPMVADDTKLTGMA